jgi:DNA-binding transcriptional regulator YdaS (Cro superfamily)
MDQADSPLSLAVQRAGSQVALASACKVTPQAVNQWLGKGRPPASKVLAIEAATGVSRHDLRPDVFGEPEGPAQ